MTTLEENTRDLVYNGVMVMPDHFWDHLPWSPSYNWRAWRKDRDPNSEYMVEE